MSGKGRGVQSVSACLKLYSLTKKDFHIGGKYNFKHALSWTLAIYAALVALRINCLKRLAFKLFTSSLNRDVNNFCFCQI